MTYRHLYRDKYVERIKRKDPRDWLQVYRLDESTGEYIPMICDKERERFRKTITVSEKCIQSTAEAEK